MKANQKYMIDERGFTFIVPMTVVIVVGFAIMAVGSFIVGEITSTLEGTYADNKNHSGTWTNRTANEDKTVSLLGNITDGFSDVVDIEIVVIIITALSMAIFAVMAMGSRRAMF